MPNIITSSSVDKIGGAIALKADAALFGNATAADVAMGKTFTSAAGVKVTGTAQAVGGSTLEEFVNSHLIYDINIPDSGNSLLLSPVAVGNGQAPCHVYIKDYYGNVSITNYTLADKEGNLRIFVRRGTTIDTMRFTLDERTGTVSLSLANYYISTLILEVKQFRLW